MLIQKMLHSAGMLTLSALLGGGLVAFSFEVTDQQIQANQRAALLRGLNEILPAERYDNDLFTDLSYVQNQTLLGTEKSVIVYRARKAGHPVAAILTPSAPDGYNGEIRLLVGINYQGQLEGVRIVSHQETPGLGDWIELRRSKWILNFKDRSLQNPLSNQWLVKRDGGIFDQFTGATITPRAVVKAVKNSLLFFQSYRDQIFK